MNSHTLRTEALCWIRYTKQFPIVTTEVGRWNADVLGISDDLMIECEIKVSLSDLKADFKNKKTKHFSYLNVDKWTQSVPNYMYFYVPKSLEEDAVKVVTELAPKYGVAVYEPGLALGTKMIDGKKTYVAKRPTKLHDSKPNIRSIKEAIARMSSQICGLHILQEKFVKGVQESIKDLSNQVLDDTSRIKSYWAAPFFPCGDENEEDVNKS